ncbi:sulfotransferase family protein [Algicella marina]|uniref:Sulfotransferase n=1 Tax=Algicella marina TaxID=2683284 RepID=A0A6P1SVQ9_9RHOB|nr:sulfotransferase [Algicella marina]QHQ34764.1 hypothetical protein GO499_05925 [Algicella marina]
MASTPPLRPTNELFDYLCPGVHKAGTTWLHAMLKQHPGTAMPMTKEVNFFNNIYRGITYPNAIRKNALKANRRAYRQLRKLNFRSALAYRAIAKGAATPDTNWYRQVFDVLPKDRRIGEFTPDYFFLGEEVVKEIKRLAPAAKVIIFVREPVARMVSALSMGIGMKPDLSQKHRVKADLFQSRGDYLSNVPIWDDVFGDNVLYIPFGDIGSNPRETIRRIEDFIGLEAFDGYADLDRKRNSHTGKVEVAPETISLIEEFAAPQRDFLQKRFGVDFCARI